MTNILYAAGEYEAAEKGSKFFGFAAPVQTAAEALALLETRRALRPQASHHVYAYDILEAGGRFTRQSDDGEPRGTAGLPVLQVFTKPEIINFLCVVTRIFGGTLLGKGGLMRAYAAAAKGSLMAAGYGPRVVRRRYVLTLPYKEWERTRYELAKNDIEIESTDFAADCRVTVTAAEAQEAALKKIAGRWKLERGEARCCSF